VHLELAGRARARPSPIDTGPQRAGRSTISVAAGRVTWISRGGAACPIGPQKLLVWGKFLTLVRTTSYRSAVHAWSACSVSVTAYRRPLGATMLPLTVLVVAGDDAHAARIAAPTICPSATSRRRGGREAGRGTPGRIGDDSTGGLHGLSGVESSCTRNYLL
jgi:hypothetical protein